MQNITHCMSKIVRNATLLVRLFHRQVVAITRFFMRFWEICGLSGERPCHTRTLTVSLLIGLLKEAGEKLSQTASIPSGFRTMNELQANQIATLINKQNMLDGTLSAANILQHKDTIFFYADGDVVIGSVKVVCVQWYQAEVKYLSVHLDYRRKGWGRKLLAEAEACVRGMGALVAQCTVRGDNLPSINLFLSSGYKETVTFTNPESGNRVHVFQKELKP